MKFSELPLEERLKLTFASIKREEELLPGINFNTSINGQYMLEIIEYVENLQQEKEIYRDALESIMGVTLFFWLNKNNQILRVQEIASDAINQEVHSNERR